MPTGTHKLPKYKVRKCFNEYIRIKSINKQVIKQ